AVLHRHGHSVDGAQRLRAPEASARGLRLALGSRDPPEDRLVALAAVRRGEHALQRAHRIVASVAKSALQRGHAQIGGTHPTSLTRLAVLVSDRRERNTEASP